MILLFIVKVLVWVYDLLGRSSEQKKTAAFDAAAQ
jgi:hypothetical protein